MTITGRTALALAVVATLFAIWSPYHWQAGLTAVLLLIVGAAILGNVTQRGQDGARSAQNPASGPREGRTDSVASQTLPRDHCPPHGRVLGKGGRG